MEVNFLTIIATIINFVLLIAIIIGVYKGIKSIKSYINRNKELDRKVDIILSKLDSKDEF